MSRPRRSRTEQIEDQFSDLSVSDQAAMLKTLTSLHRWCQRERSRKPEANGKPTQESAAELFQRGQQVLAQMDKEE